MIPKEKQEKFDKIVEVLKEAYEDGTLNKAINSALDIILDSIDPPQEHFGTFAEFKHIDEFNAPLLPDEIISRSSCGWATADIQEAIRRAKEYEDKSK